MSNKIEQRTYTLTVERCPKTDRVVTESWSDEQGRLSNHGDNYAYIRYDEDGDAVIILYAVDGIPHRENNLPSNYTVDLDNSTETYKYKQHGRPHRTDGAAVEVFDLETGKCLKREFWIDGQRVSPFGQGLQPELD